MTIAAETFSDGSAALHERHLGERVVSKAAGTTLRAVPVRILTLVQTADVARLRKASVLLCFFGGGEPCWCESSRRA